MGIRVFAKKSENPMNKSVVLLFFVISVALCLFALSLCNFVAEEVAPKHSHGVVIAPQGRSLTLSIRSIFMTDNSEEESSGIDGVSSNNHAVTLGAVTNSRKDSLITTRSAKVGSTETPVVMATNSTNTTATPGAKTLTAKQIAKAKAAALKGKAKAKLKAMMNGHFNYIGLLASEPYGHKTCKFGFKLTSSLAAVCVVVTTLGNIKNFFVLAYQIGFDKMKACRKSLRMATMAHIALLAVSVFIMLKGSCKKKCSIGVGVIVILLATVLQIMAFLALGQPTPEEIAASEEDALANKFNAKMDELKNNKVVRFFRRKKKKGDAEDGDAEEVVKPKKKKKTRWVRSKTVIEEEEEDEDVEMGGTEGERAETPEEGENPVEEVKKKKTGIFKRNKKIKEEKATKTKKKRRLFSRKKKNDHIDSSAAGEDDNELQNEANMITENEAKIGSHSAELQEKAKAQQLKEENIGKMAAAAEATNKEAEDFLSMAESLEEAMEEQKKRYNPRSRRKRK